MWDEPLIREDETFDLGGRITREDINHAIEQSVAIKQERA